MQHEEMQCAVASQDKRIGPGDICRACDFVRLHWTRSKYPIAGDLHLGELQRLFQANGAATEPKFGPAASPTLVETLDLSLIRVPKNAMEQMHEIELECFCQSIHMITTKVLV